MSDLPVSVIVVSRGRPEALKRCLTGISQLRFQTFEVIVVADEAGLDAVAELPFETRIKTVFYDEANISQARNLGISRAAGDVVAFIDDDAVPEPSWLMYLVAPFAQGEVAAAGGYVRGRNGISFQWRAQSVDQTGESTRLDVAGVQAVVLHPQAGRAIRTEGTNMAFRRDVLAELGGFDPAYRYYLDETDVNLRLAAAGHATAIAPRAEVHHGFLQNAQRSDARVPRDLTEIGASKAVFLAKHCSEAKRAEVWTMFRRGQRARLQRHMVRGNMMPADVRRLMRGLDQGYRDGQAREFGGMAPIARASEGLREFEPHFGKSVVVSGRSWQARKTHARARKLVAQGQVPSVFLFSPSSLYHQLRYHPDGYWVQTGGLFGRSERKQPLFRLTSFKKRLKHEIQRVAVVRLLDDETVE